MLTLKKPVQEVGQVERISNRRVRRQEEKLSMLAFILVLKG
jgi:hypothetical protein